MMELVKHFYIILYLAFCLISCNRDKFCDIEITNCDIKIYNEISKTILADKSIVDSYRNIKIENDSKLDEKINNLNFKPISIRKSQNVFTAVLLQNDTWYMERDILYLTISKDTTHTSLYWDGEDKQFLLNCQRKIDENTRLRSITIHN